jgi:hypothetical protein
MTRHWFALAVGFAGCIALGVTPAARADDKCAELPLTAQGEPSRFEWLARTKARANWRSRVRATKQLGADYSGWSRAQNRDERCDAANDGVVVCSFTGTPCKP